MLSRAVCRGMSKKKRDYREMRLSMAVNTRLEYYRAKGLIDCVFFCVRNEERDEDLRQLDAAMGVKAGCHDWIFQAGHFGAQIELKGDGGVLSASQIEFKTWLDEFGVRHATCWTFDDFFDVLREWGVLRG